jgi:hypothetical protein
MVFPLADTHCLCTPRKRKRPRGFLHSGEFWTCNAPYLLRRVVMVTGAVDLCALLQAAVVINDVEIIISVIQVLRDKTSRGSYLRAPRFRTATGEWRCAIECAGTTLWNAVMDLLCDALKERAAQANRGG